MTSESIEYLNNVDKFILLLLDAKNAEPVPGPLHLQKEMYLLQNLFPKLAAETDYEPYMLGPHSEMVDDEVEELASSGLIRTMPGQFELTRDGESIVSILKERTNKKEIEKINEFKDLLNDMSRDELLAFVYFTYPDKKDLEEESIEYENLLQKRKRLAISMYKKDKISAQKAAEIAGESFEDFFDELKVV